MSTPRTDALSEVVYKHYLGKSPDEVVEGAPDADVWKHARQLETELQSAEAKLAVMAEVLTMVLAHCDADSSGETIFERAVIHARKTVRDLPERAQRLQAVVAAALKVERKAKSVVSLSPADFGASNQESYWSGVTELRAAVRAYQGDSDG